MKNSDIFHISAQNIDCGYSLEPPRRGGSNEYPLSMYLSRNKKNNVYPCKPQFYYIRVGFKGGQHYIGMFSWCRGMRTWTQASHHENIPVIVNNFDPLKSHLYIVKLGFTVIYISLFGFARNHRLWVLVRTASLRRFERVPTIYVLSRNMKNIRVFFLSAIFQFMEVKLSIYLNRSVFVMTSLLFDTV